MVRMWSVFDAYIARGMRNSFAILPVKLTSSAIAEGGDKTALIQELFCYVNKELRKLSVSPF